MEKLVEVRNLSKYFCRRSFWGQNQGVTKAVDGVSFDINKGETFGLVGESGCGKSTLGRTIIRMYKPTSGEIIYDGKNIAMLRKSKISQFNKNMQIIFQDPYSSLDPHLTIRDIIAEPISVYEKLTDSEIDLRVEGLLKKVGLKSDDMNKYSYEFSGGQRQRIGIARALSVNPKFVLCDEPISALDVSIQAQVINVLEELQEELGLTYLFVAHDLTMVHHISSRIGVMYLGKIVEIGDSDEIYFNPKHPYTRALIESIPRIEQDRILKLDREVIHGDIPSPLNVPKGCRFHPRCPYATERCRCEEPQLAADKNGRMTACFNAV